MINDSTIRAGRQGISDKKEMVSIEEILESDNREHMLRQLHLLMTRPDRKTIMYRIGRKLSPFSADVEKLKRLLPVWQDLMASCEIIKLKCPGVFHINPLIDFIVVSTNSFTSEYYPMGNMPIERYGELLLQLRLLYKDQKTNEMRRNFERSITENNREIVHRLHAAGFARNCWLIRAWFGYRLRSEYALNFHNVLADKNALLAALRSEVGFVTGYMWNLSYSHARGWFICAIVSISDNDLMQDEASVLFDKIMFIWERITSYRGESVNYGIAHSIEFDCYDPSTHHPALTKKYAEFAAPIVKAMKLTHPGGGKLMGVWNNTRRNCPR